MSTIKKIKEFQKFGSKLGLERMKRLMDLLGKPQEGLKVIHVGGTNGKGSVSAYIYSVLKENGYSVGLFTSPFMDGFQNSITIGDVSKDLPITEKELDEYYDKIKIAITKLKEEGLDSPTEFEVITAIALMHFSHHNPDFVVLEVGLGGIGDSTNVIEKPLLSIISSVSLDHCDVLGNTIEEIAHEKAGIIKAGVPVIINLERDDAIVIAREAYEKGAPLINVAFLKPVGVESTASGNRFSVSIDGINYPGMKTGMAGAHQIGNALCALAAIEYFRKKAFVKLDSEATVRGLQKAKLEGRFEIIERDSKPTLILDGAHNEAGAKSLADAMESFFSDKNILTVYAIKEDKDTDGIINEFSRFTDDYLPVDMFSEGEENFDFGSLAQRISAEDGYDIIVITGSLYLIRNIRGYFFS